MVKASAEASKAVATEKQPVLLGANGLCAFNRMRDICGSAKYAAAAVIDEPLVKTVYTGFDIASHGCQSLTFFHHIPDITVLAIGEHGSGAAIMALNT